MSHLSVILSFLLVSNCLSVEIVNLNVKQYIDITTHLLKVTNEISFINSLPDKVYGYVFYVEPKFNYTIEFFNGEFEKLKYVKDDDASRLVITLEPPVEPNYTCTIIAKITYIDKVIPYYKFKKYKQDQFLLYIGNANFYSPYTTNVVETRISVTPNSIQRILLNGEYGDSDILTFTFKNVSAWSYDELEIKIKNNNPILVVTRLEKTIDISSYGEIFVEDKVFIKNKGTKVIGSYEPQPFRLPIEGTSWLYTYLPAAAKNIKFFDKLGNNSNSQVIHHLDYTTLKFRTRYPLLGGWQSQYIVQYSLPNYEYLKHNNFDTYFMKMRVFDHVLNDCVVESANVKILLPEGASVLKASAPNIMSRIAFQNHKTSLCLHDRLAVVVNGTMLLENHISDFEIVYQYSLFQMLRVPLLLSFYVLQCVFLPTIYYYRVIKNL